MMTDELKDIIARTTPGPWVATERSDYHEILAPHHTTNWFGRERMHAVVYIDTELDEAEREANAAFIAAARTALPEALARIEALEASVVNLERDCSELRKGEEVTAGCEACSAWLLSSDDYVSSDNGCSGCWAAMTDYPTKSKHPCYAYRAGKPDARNALNRSAQP